MKRRFSILSLSISITLAALLLLSSCAAPSEDVTNTTTTTTTTAEPQNTYRPDLQWGDGMYRVSDIVEIVKHECTPNASYSTKPVPCKVVVTITPADESEEIRRFSPTEYLESLGWEVLPEDAWYHISGGKASNVYYAAPNGGALYSFNLTGMMNYYELDPNLISEERIWVTITQSKLKEIES